MQSIRQPEVITQTPVPLTSAAPAAAQPAQASEGASFGEALNQSVAQAETRRMVRKGESATPGVDKPVTVASELSFYDFLDIINPLQHIPIVSDYYREATGDTIKPELKLAGGAITGGIFGFFASLADVIFEGENGESMGKAVASSLSGEPSKKQVASANTNKADEPVQFASLSAPVMPVTSTAPTDDVLSVFGTSNASAHTSYTQANMLGYLRDVSVSEKI